MDRTLKLNKKGEWNKYLITDKLYDWLDSTL